MLEKKAGVYDVEKVRIILLYDAEFNFLNKLMGKQLTAYGEANNLIAEEQYGSRKHKTAIDQALNKRIIFDLWKCQQKTASLCSNDARQC